MAPERIMSDKEALDAICKGLRTPEWSVSFLEDIAWLVKATGRDTEQPNAFEQDDWRSH